MPYFNSLYDSYVIIYYSLSKNIMRTLLEKPIKVPSMIVTAMPSLFRGETATAGDGNFSQSFTELSLFITPILPSLPTINILPSTGP